MHWGLFMKNIAFPIRNSIRAKLGIYSDQNGIEIFTDRKIDKGSAQNLGTNVFDGDVKNHYFISSESEDLGHILEYSGIRDFISESILSGLKPQKGPVAFRTPSIMAVANATPDSFYPGSRLDQSNSLIDSLIDAGPDIVDIGGESTRPGSHELSAREEIARIEPVLEHVQETSDIPVSLDTRHPEVLEYFAHRVQYANDISGFREERMVEIASDHSLKCITMHMRGIPSNMQTMTDYVDIMPEVLSHLLESAERLEAAGIRREDIIIDPGLGFSKDFKGNLELISEARSFSVGYKTLFGASRKSFIGRITGEETEGRLPGTLAVTAFLVDRGVDIIRVHDPKENIQLIKVLKAMSNGWH